MPNQKDLNWDMVSEFTLGVQATSKIVSCQGEFTQGFHCCNL